MISKIFNLLLIPISVVSYESILKSFFQFDLGFLVFSYQTPKKRTGAGCPETDKCPCFIPDVPGMALIPRDPDHGGHMTENINFAS